MARTPQDVTDTELAILHLLWKQGPATRRYLTDRLYPGGDTAQYATVQKLLERLEAKGFVRHHREDGVLIFTAAVSREELIGRRLRDVADKLCGGALTPLLLQLVQARPLKEQEINELHSLIDELAKTGKRPGKRR